MIDFIMKEAAAIGDRVQDSLGKVSSVEKKVKHDIVTEIDYANEKALIQAIRGEFPDHAVFTEELGFVGRRNSQFIWVIDPIDGTINYAAGLPIYNISIALAVNGNVSLGVIYDPSNKRMYFARSGHGAFVNGKKLDAKLGVQCKTSLKDSLVYVSLSTHDDFEIVNQTLKIWQKMHPNVRGIRMLGSSALGLAYVAAGVFDVMIRLKADPWGAAAGTLIVQEAGGIVSTVSGQPWRIRFDHAKHEGFIAANYCLYEKVKRMIRQT